MFLSIARNIYLCFEGKSLWQMIVEQLEDLLVRILLLAAMISFVRILFNYFYIFYKLCQNSLSEYPQLLNLHWCFHTGVFKLVFMKYVFYL